MDEFIVIAKATKKAKVKVGKELPIMDTDETLVKRYDDIDEAKESGEMWIGNGYVSEYAVFRRA